MNGYRAGASLAQSDDDEALIESDLDDESEGILDVLGNVLDPLGIRQIFTGPPRPPLPPMPTPPIAPQGVDRATLNTPRGSATLQLPQPVVTKDEFNQAMQEVKAAVDRNAARANTIQADLGKLTQRVGTMAAESQRDFRRVRREIAQVRRENSTAITNLRKEQSQQATTNMLMTFMMERQIQDQINSHTHGIDFSHDHPFQGAAATGNEGANPNTATTGSSTTGSTAGDTSSMFLPLMMMMMASPGGGTDESMTWLPLMFLFQ
jgi:hypothetical protein